jgi:putative transposase
MMVAIPPQYALSQVIGFIKGKSAIHLARVNGERRGILSGNISGRGGTGVPTVGRDEAVIRESIRNQEHEDERLARWVCGAELPPRRWHQSVGAALATPPSRFERLTN